MVMREDGGGCKEAAAALRRSVKQLHFGVWEEKAAAAVEIKRLAREGPSGVKKSLAALGVVPSLLDMLDFEDDGMRKLAVEALVELADGTYSNKVLMVESGILERLNTLKGNKQDHCKRDEELLPLLLSISSLAKTHFHIASSCSSTLPPLLIKILATTGADDKTKMTALSTLCNLSVELENVKAMVTNGAVPILLRLAKERPTSGRALATLGNLVVTAAGRKAIEEEETMVPGCLIEAMAWDDMPKSQELAAYLLMVLAHGNAAQTRRMAGMGIVPVLLEVALLGTPLAQRRALKILEWFKDEKKKGIVTVHSGPQVKRVGGGDLSYAEKIDGRGRKEYREGIQRMVKQSLNRNMVSIVRRASRGCEGSCDLSDLVGSSSSKSLPF